MQVMIRACLLVLSASAAMLGGCTSAEPPYPVEVLAYDEGLVGRWEQTREPGKKQDERIVLEITSREITVKEGKVDASGMGPDGLRKDQEPRETRRAYMFRYETEPGKATTLMAVLFNAGGRQFAGMQIPPVQMNDAGLSGWVIPVHRVVGLEREGDVLRASSGAFDVAWIPGVEILDGAGGTKDTVKTLTDEKAGPHVTTDIGRVIELYAEAATKDGVWRGAIEFRRAGGTAPSDGRSGGAR
ncbi:MAG: hypothetical protein AB7K52_13060 [Phycisphaerales bacterium]